MRATFGFFKPLDFHHPRVRLESVGDAALRRCRCHGRLRRAGAVATNVANVAARMRVHGGRCLRLRLGRSVQGVGALMEGETKGLERRDLLCFRLRAKAVEELGPALSAARFCRVPISILGCASKLPRVWHDTHRRCAAIGFPPIWCAIAVGALFPPPERSTRGAGFERCAGFSFFS